MYIRPKPQETEEDLLRLQEEFQKNLSENKIKLAAKVISSEKDKAQNKDKSNELEEDVKEQLANTFESIPSNINIGNIIEKRKNTKIYEVPCPLVFSEKNGFPKAKRRNQNCSEQDTHNKKSLFAQQIKRNQDANLKTEQNNASFSNEPNRLSTPMEQDEEETKIKFSEGILNSKILSDHEKEDIHKENIKIIEETPMQELKEERQMLMDSMDPALLAYLKERHNKRVNKSSNPTISKQNEEGNATAIQNLPSAMEVLMQPEAEKWLNFDFFESHKMSWMKDIIMKKEEKIDKNKAFEARFDFNGWLLPLKNEEITEANRILYHHGEEPERPGYTLQELFTLSRSSVAQQKILALNTISNILNLYNSGVYQDIIDIPIEQLFFLIRFCMDDNTPAVLNSSVKAMRSLIYNHIDEICLDCVLGFGLGKTIPLLPVDCVMEDDNTVNDQQLCETNIIRCAIRSGICNRIRYIFNTIRPPLDTIVYCLEILIRLLKDSNFVKDQVVKCDGLIKSIITNFIPHTGYKDSSYGFPVLHAIKFFRILSCRAKVYANEIIQKYNLVDTILIYISDDYFSGNSNGLKLQTECFHFLTILFEYRTNLESISNCEEIVLRHLDYHFKNTNISERTTFIREAHCSSLLILLNTLVTIDILFASKLLGLVKSCLSKWGKQIIQMQNFKCGKSQILSSIILLSSNIGTLCCDMNDFDSIVMDLLNCNTFLQSLSGIKESSMVLNNYEPQNFSANLKTLQCAIWYTSEHIIPILKTNSPIPFLTTLSEYIKNSNNLQMKINFLKCEIINEYILTLKNKKRPHLTTHWFTRIEAQFLVNILKISVSTQKLLDTSIFYELAVKVLCVFNVEQQNDIRFILQNIIFCSTFYPCDALLKNLNLNDKYSLEISLNNLENIFDVYIEVLGIKFDNQVRSNFIVYVDSYNIIPLDWVFTPIVLFYNNQNSKNDKYSEEKQIFIVKNCLRWILIYETYFPTLMASLDPTDRFCRLTCVFLASDNLFLNKEIHDILELCLKNLLQNFEHKLNFNKTIEGLSNFQDFFNQMLEQYQGVSYGDLLFGNFILIPLAQKQNVQWRKTLWSEYMGVVQVLNVSKETFLGNLDLYLSPIEDNESLLKCYRGSLMRNLVRKTSILYTIASHHYKMYLSKKCEKV